MNNAPVLPIYLSLLLPVCTTQASGQNPAVQPESKTHTWENRNGTTWEGRHELVKKRVQEGKVDLIFVGDSITHNWEAPDKGGPAWDQYYAHRNAVNMGFGGDRTQHVLWRLENGEVEGISPKVAVVLIGTNNWVDNTSAEIAEGVVAVCEKLREKLPETKILLLAIFPRKEPDSYSRKITQGANAIFSRIADDRWIHYLDLGEYFVAEDGTIPEEIMPDGLHPAEKGYRIWAEKMEPKLKELLGEE